MPTINLSLPKSWDALTTLQLEQVSQLFIDHARRYTQTGHYSQDALMVEAFFLLSGLEPITPPLIDDADGEPTLAYDDTDPMQIYYLCQFRDKEQREKRQSAAAYDIPLAEGKERKGESSKEKLPSTPLHSASHTPPLLDIKLYLHEIHSIAIGGIDPKELTRYLTRQAKRDVARQNGQTVKGEDPEPPTPKGRLSWLLRHSTRTIVPYEEITLPDPHSRDKKLMERYLDPQTLQPATRRYPATVTLTGPQEYMQDFTWRQYRFASELRTYLAKVENQLIQMQKRHMPQSRIEQQQQIVRELRAQFLATLYSRPVLFTDPDTQQLTYEAHFLPSQTSQNAYLFMDFPEAKFQAIDFWWQGMMHYLQREYPKVFRSSEVKPIVPEDDNPFTLYTRSTTTMIKYAAANEREVNDTTYTIILQHIQDMADENDRIKDMKKSN